MTNTFMKRTSEEYAIFHFQFLCQENKLQENNMRNLRYTSSILFYLVFGVNYKIRRLSPPAYHV